MLVALLTTGLSCAPNEPTRPNFIFIFTDDHGVQAISAYGSLINETPNIDRLAQQGMIFRNAFVTNSICAPSRAVILTGKYSHLNGQLTNVETFDGSQQTFPKLLQRAGYQTAIFGKWHLKSDPLVSTSGKCSSAKVRITTRRFDLQKARPRSPATRLTSLPTSPSTGSRPDETPASRS